MDKVEIHEADDFAAAWRRTMRECLYVLTAGLVAITVLTGCMV